MANQITLNEVKSNENIYTNHWVFKGKVNSYNIECNCFICQNIYISQSRLLNQSKIMLEKETAEVNRFTPHCIQRT